MPIKKENKGKYPKDWPTISLQARERAAWRCQHEGCTAQQYDVGMWMRSRSGPFWMAKAERVHEYAYARQLAAELHFRAYGDGPAPKGEPDIIVIVLTVAHLDHDPTNCAPDNLFVACQRHHLAYDQQHHIETAYATRVAKRNNLELPL
jgi:hypothetical protein